MVRLMVVLMLELCLVSFGQTFQTSNLPILIVDCPQSIPDEPKTTATLKIIDNAPGQLNNITDPPNGYNGFIGIELRGSTSQGLSAKKPYGIETRDALGNEILVSLLGMPAESDWALIAPYSDKSLMRDALAYLLAGKIMPYAPRVRFCELVLNGAYQGVYVLAENIKRDANRVNISKLTNLDISGDNLTGGYILKIDKPTGGAGVDGWTSPRTPSIFYQLHYPKPDVILPEQRQYIFGFLEQFEQVMASEGYKNPVTGYQSILDIDTFVDFLIVNELARNVDGYRLSTFLYKDKNSKDPRLKMGPVWDFNITFGNANYCKGGDVTGYAYDFNSVCPGDFWQVPFWWNRLLSDNTFRLKVGNRWKNLRQDRFSDQSLLLKVDSMATLLASASVRNFQTWDILGTWIWPNNFVGGSYANEVSYLKTWIINRAAWLDNAFNGFLVPVYDTNDYEPPIISPNPSKDNEEVVFWYYVHDYTPVSISIYNSNGQTVNTLIDNKHVNGWDKSVWDNPTLAAGVYYYKILFDGKPVGTGRIIRK